MANAVPSFLSLATPTVSRTTIRRANAEAVLEIMKARKEEAQSVPYKSGNCQSLHRSIPERGIEAYYGTYDLVLTTLSRFFPTQGQIMASTTGRNDAE